MYVDIKLQVVPIKLRLIVVQQVIWFSLHIIHNVVEALDHQVQPINVGMMCKSGELMYGGEHGGQLVKSL